MNSYATLEYANEFLASMLGTESWAQAFPRSFEAVSRQEETNFAETSSCEAGSAKQKPKPRQRK